MKFIEQIKFLGIISISWFTGCFMVFTIMKLFLFHQYEWLDVLIMSSTVGIWIFLCGLLSIILKLRKIKLI